MATTLGAVAADRTDALRSDAQQNRARIIDAARIALADDPTPSMKSIATAAGVGQGTLYRHFPNREALVLEVHRTDVAALVDAAPTLLDDHEPVVALRRWLDQLADYGRIKVGLGAVLEDVTRSKLTEEGYGPVVGAIRLLLDACIAAGEVKQSVDAEDVLVLVSFLWRAEAGGPDRSRQLLDVVIDGLRT